MDPLIGNLVNLGGVGILAGALLYFMHHFLTKSLPEMQKNLRDDLAEARGQFLNALQIQQDGFRKTLSEIQASLNAAVTRIEDRAERSIAIVIAKIDIVDHQTRTNADHLINLQKTIIETFSRKEQTK